MPVQMLQKDAGMSHLYQKAPKDVIRTLSTTPSTSNFHHWCLTQSAVSTSGLDAVFKVLATSTDDDGLVYVASLEAASRPIWAVQFHPEKGAYEWGNYTSIPHNPEAIKAGNYFAEFFVNQGNCS